MSRIGRLPVPIPDGVQVTIDGHHVAVKGPKGELSLDAHPEMMLAQGEKEITVTRPSDVKAHRALHGMTRALINNMVVGVTQGFQKDLEVVGVGYTAELRSRVLTLKLGFTHPIVFHLPEGINVEVPKPTQIIISGIDKQLVGEVASVIRGMKPPEPYKGKGIRYKGEYIERKAGKAGKTA